MTHQLSLQDREMELMLELLEAERRELPSEIRRSETTRWHDDLQERMRVIDHLIDRLRQAPVQ